MKSAAMLPQSKRLDDRARLWVRKEDGVEGYASEDGKYEILIGDGCVRLVSFVHEPVRTGKGVCKFWRKWFRSMEDAMDYAERI